MLTLLKRKPLLFLPVFCQLLQCISYGLNYWFMKQMDWRFLYLELIWDFGGCYVAYYMMEYSYMVDVTTVADRYKNNGSKKGTNSPKKEH